MFKVLLTSYFQETYPEEWSAITASLAAEQIIYDVNEVRPGDVVLPRYRTVPFGELLDDEVKSFGGRLINTAAESAAVRDLYSWIGLLSSWTPPAYDLTTLEGAPEGRFFVKGQTSSLKYLGPQAVFADSKAEAYAMGKALTEHDWLSDERVAIRPLQDYRLVGYSRKGLPMFNERRAFTYQGRLLSEGFYWDANRSGLFTGEPPQPNAEFFAAVDTVLALLTGEVCDFLVVDFAEYRDGTWGVVELNDGCQAGFAGADPCAVYSGLASLY